MAKGSKLNWLEHLIAPASVIAGLGVGFMYLESRFASIDRRFDTLAAEVSGVRARTDTVVDSQAAMKSELTIVSDRVNRIAIKLDVASAPANSLAVEMLRKGDPVKTLRDAGYKVERAKEALKYPETEIPAIMKGTDKSDWYLFDATKGDLKPR